MEEVQVFIKPLGKAPIPINVRLTDSIDEVIDKFKQNQDLNSHEECQLIFNGRSYWGDRSLADCQIDEDDVLHLQVFERDWMQIRIKTMTGKSFIAIVTPSDSVEKLKLKIEQLDETPPTQQRLIFEGRQLEDRKTLGSYQMENESTVHLVLRMVGMISSFTTTEATDLFDGFLLGLNPAPANKAFTKKWKRVPFNDYTLEVDSTILSPAQRLTCMKFLDELWAEEAMIYQEEHNKPLVDLKVKFEDEEAAELLLGYRSPDDPAHNAEAFDQLLNKHSREGYGGACLALRCSRGPVSGAIGWHFDGPYATETIQMALNNDSEYEGGRLCFFTLERGVEVLNRNAGDLTKHGREALHAVTRLTSGIRYSLFVVDRSNGLGDSLVIRPSPELTQTIMAKIQRQEIAAAASTSSTSANNEVDQGGFV
jgi:ubiquitin